MFLYSIVCSVVLMRDEAVMWSSLPTTALEIDDLIRVLCGMVLKRAG